MNTRIPHALTLFDERRRPWLVRLVQPGEAYGLADSLVAKSVLVEFYDLTASPTFGERGQFVSRYDASTIAASRGGLDLGGAPAWCVDSGLMDQVRRFLAVRVTT